MNPLKKHEETVKTEMGNRREQKVTGNTRKNNGTTGERQKTKGIKG